MKNLHFDIFVYSFAHTLNTTMSISTINTGANAVIDCQSQNDTNCLQQYCKNLKNKNFAVRVGFYSRDILSILIPFASQITHIIIPEYYVEQIEEYKKYLHDISIIIECTSRDIPLIVQKKLVDGVIIKGNEAGGFVGEESSFILLQQWIKQTDLPIYIHGGLTPHSAAALSVMGFAGGVLDNQVLLLEESSINSALEKVIANLSGSETIAAGDGEKGNYYRVLNHPRLKKTKEFLNEVEGKSGKELEKIVENYSCDFNNPEQGILPLGHDICFAPLWQKQYGSIFKVIKAFNKAIESYAKIAKDNTPLLENNSFSQSIGTQYPIIQGPMTRVSDTADFANAIAEGGALPMLALALLNGQSVDKLLFETKEKLQKKKWGIGLLGFIPPTLLNEQIEVSLKYKPDFAIIAGGRPDQAVAMEQKGIPSFLHLPSASLLANFIKGGARRFIFEGRECGGHIGPLSSFVLWSTMIDRIIYEIDQNGIKGSDLHCVFAGGIHNDFSSALLQIMLAPLSQRGVNLGIIMGSVYLFTKEIVESKAIVQEFQNIVLECNHTVNLETGPGHASRCAYTNFAKKFFNTRRDLLGDKTIPVDTVRETLDDMIMGTLRIASKGTTRRKEDAQLVEVDTLEQRENGMYMLGQIVALRHDITTIKDVHKNVIQKAAHLLEKKCNQHIKSTKNTNNDNLLKPADIAIVGIATAVPGAKNRREFWENILDQVDSVSEIPPHRWDYNLYFDENRDAKDKIYSKWGGFLEDMIFDPMRYGITPKSLVSVDPMQLMALDIARQALDDAGFDASDDDLRAKTSVIVGASGGAGDVGMQYGLRSELPRFHGELPEDIAESLPEWSEDTFAGILINVVAGRIANRLNLGGMNFTTDAACASSLAAVYQAVNDLQTGRSNMAIAGGVDTVQGPFGFMCFSKTQALSPRGKCRTFDQHGDGIAISEGIVMLVLKRLDDAIENGDKIYSVIKGIGSGSDGKAKGLSAPEPQGQLRAMQRAYEQSGFKPATVSLFEAHGTGTVAGDTSELQSTGMLVAQGGGTVHNAVIGSVKTLIGHTKATAGIAGMAKAALALYHKTLPAHGYFDAPNKVLCEENAPLYILKDTRPWIKNVDYPRRAAVSAFGFGGTNFHAVMEEYEDPYQISKKEALRDKWQAELFVLNAENKHGLQKNIEEILIVIAENHDIYLRDLSKMILKNAKASDHNIAFIAKDFNDLSFKLQSAIEFLSQNKALPKDVHYAQKDNNTKIALLFSGQGSQYIEMGAILATYFDCITDVLEEADSILKDDFSKRFRKNKTLSQFVYPPALYNDADIQKANDALKSTDVAQPALGAIEVGFLKLLEQFNVQANMVAGHSYGEFVALYAAGCLSFEELMKISEARGRLIIDCAKNAGIDLGTMAAVSATREDVEADIKDIEGVIVANHNAPRQIIISGNTQAVQKASEKLQANNKRVTFIPVAAAFHSPAVEPARVEFSKILQNINWQNARCDVYSNATGDKHDIDSLQTAMANHLVQSVEFVKQIETMYQDGGRIFIEVGPKNVLTNLVSRILNDKNHIAIALDNGNDGLSGLLNVLAVLASQGIDLNYQLLFKGRDCLNLDTKTINQAKRTVEIPKSAWFINGSGVRKHTEPIKQIGLTYQQAQTKKHSKNIQNIQNENKQIQPVMTKNIHIQSQSLTQKRSFMNQNTYGGGQNVAQAYFEFLSQQLNNARDVALASMGQQPIVQSDVTTNMRNTQMDISIPKVPQMPIVTMPVSIPQIQLNPATQLPTQNIVSPKVVVPIVEAVREFAKPVIAIANKNTALDEKALRSIIVSVVTEKTGYEEDMIAFDQNLEADLGVDSIKRVDIVGGILDQLPASYGKELGDSGRTKLNTSKTLDEILSNIIAVNDNLQAKGQSVNFNSAEMASARETIIKKDSFSSFQLTKARSRIVAFADDIPANAKLSLEKGTYILTQDSLGVANQLAEKLQKEGNQTIIIDEKNLNNEKNLITWLNQNEFKNISGIVHLTPLNLKNLNLNDNIDDLKTQIFIAEKSFFLIVKHYSNQLQAKAHIVSTSKLGGLYARDKKKQENLLLQGGLVGLIKSIKKEKTDLRTRAIDFDIQDIADLTDIIVKEMSVEGGRIEVGYKNQQRHIFKTVEEGIDGENLPLLQGHVILVTGGARGVTAEVLRSIVTKDLTLILTGRKSLPNLEDALRHNQELANLQDEKEIARYFAKTKNLPFGDARRAASNVIANREMLDNISDFEVSGAKVIYKAVDVIDEKAVSNLLNDIYSTYNRLDGVVHGAGIIEDKYLSDISSESWDRVYNTKVQGLLILSKYVKSDLKFLTVFSSVAGRYGNSGQANYATANEMMNRICSQIQNLWNDKVRVSSLCWGPWSATKFGAGMITPATEEKFAKQGVHLVSAYQGQKLFHHQITIGNDVEIICGVAPWESEETKLGQYVIDKTIPTLLPLIQDTKINMLSGGKVGIDVTLNAKDAYLQDHIINGKPVFPFAMALELMSQSVAKAFGDNWVITGLQDCQLFKGIIVEEDTKDLTIVMTASHHGSADHMEVKVKMTSKNTPQPHYGATIILASNLDNTNVTIPAIAGNEVVLTAKQAYDDILFHGKVFQVIKNIELLTEQGMEAVLSASTTKMLLNSDGKWLFDPAIIDGIAQASLIYTGALKNSFVLPVSFGKITRYVTEFPEKTKMYFKVLNYTFEDILADVILTNEQGDVILTVDNMRHIVTTSYKGKTKKDLAA